LFPFKLPLRHRIKPNRWQLFKLLSLLQPKLWPVQRRPVCFQMLQPKRLMQHRLNPYGAQRRPVYYRPLRFKLQLQQRLTLCRSRHLLFKPLSPRRLKLYRS
jgi:hypothetical protein